MFPSFLNTTRCATYPFRFNTANYHGSLTIDTPTQTVTKDSPAGWCHVRSNQPMKSGQHLCVFEVVDRGPNAHVQIGIVDPSKGLTENSGPRLYLHNQYRYVGGSGSAVTPLGCDPNRIRNARYITLLVDMDAKMVFAFIDGALSLGCIGGPDDMPASSYVFQVATHDVHTKVRVVPSTSVSPLEAAPVSIPKPVACSAKPVTYHKVQWDRNRRHAALAGPLHGTAVVAQTKVLDIWKSIYGTEPLPETGLHYFSVAIVGRGTTGRVMIGISDGQVDVGASAYPGVGTCPGAALYLADGNVYRNTGNGYGYATPSVLHAAKSIGVLLDMDRKMLSFFADGVSLGLAAGPATLRAGKYFPVVSLRDMGTSIVSNAVETPGTAQAASPQASPMPELCPPLPDSILRLKNGLNLHRPQFDPLHHAFGLSLTEDNHCVMVTTNGVWRTAFSTKRITSGLWYWSFEVQRHGNDSRILLGVSDGGAACVSGDYSWIGNGACKGAALNLRNGHRCYASKSEGVPNAGNAKHTNHVGLLLDMTARTLEVYLDGTSHLVAGPSELTSSTGYYPAVSLYDFGAKIVSTELHFPKSL